MYSMRSTNGRKKLYKTKTWKLETIIEIVFILATVIDIEVVYIKASFLDFKVVDI